MRRRGYRLAVASLPFVIAACGGGGGGGGPAPTASPDSGTVSGGAMKGPLRGADITVCDVENCEAPADTATTDSFGNFSVSLPAHGRYFVSACNGSFVDESDPAPVKRTIDLAGECLGQVTLPAGASSVAYNVLTLAAQRGADRASGEKQALCPAVRNEHVFDVLSAQISAAFGFDVMTTLPQGNPTNPAGSVTQKQYAMVLGGTAQAINEAAGRSGLSAMDAATIEAVVADLSDGVLDGQEDGQPLGLPSNPLPLNAQIQRFKNNNANAYADVPTVVADENMLAAGVNLGPYGEDQSLTVPLPGGSSSVPLADVLGAACDPEGDAILGTVAFPVLPAHGSVNVAAGVITYTHDGGAATSDSFSYRLTDSQNRQGPAAQVFVDITPLPPCAAVPANLLAWYAGDGNGNDLAGGNHGILGNGAGFATAKVGQGFSLDGADDYVDIGASAAARSSADLTVDAWVSVQPPAASAPAAGHYLFARRDPAAGVGGEGLSIEIYDDDADADALGDLAITIGAASHGSGASLQVAPDAVPMNTLTHIAVTYDDAGVLKAYVDGVDVALVNNGLVGPASFSGALRATGSLFIGRRQDAALVGLGPAAHFRGLVDELEIFDRALSQAEIQAIVAAGFSGKCKPAAGSDDDGDGLSFAQEMALGTNPALDDTDGDGASDFDEVSNDGNPNDFNPGAGDTDPRVNAPPVISGDLAIEAAAGSDYVLTSADLLATDPEGGLPGTLTYSVLSAPAAGTLEVGGTPAASFTQADLAAGEVVFVHDGTSTGPDSFDFQVSDVGGGTAANTVLVRIYLVGSNLLVSHLPSSPVTTSSTPPVGTPPANTFGPESLLQNSSRQASRQMSADGRYVVFASRASDIVAGQVEAGASIFSQDVFLYDRDTGLVKLVSHSTAGPATTCNAGANFPAISADGKYVAFVSGCSDLISGASGGQQIYLYDVAADSFTLVSHAFGGTSGSNGSCAAPSVASTAAGGVWVAYHCAATNLISGQVDTAGTLDVFLFEKASGVNTLVSHTVGGAATASGSGGATSLSRFPQLSDDGRYVLYNSLADAASMAGVTDANGTGATGADLFLFDRTTGVNTLINASAATPGATANALSDSEVMSADGRFVAFRSAATDLAAVSDSNAGEDIFLFDRASGTVALVSHAAGLPAMAANDRSNSPTISADGSYLAFSSEATDLIAGFVEVNDSASDLPDIFVYNRDADAVIAVASHSIAGPTVGSGPAGASSSFPIISADGSHVVFRSTATDLIGGLTETNSVNDVFLWDNVSGIVRLISRSGADYRTTASSPSATTVPHALSQDGKQVAFHSIATDLLTGQADANGVLDVFLHFEADNQTTDSDGDGLTDLQETRLGTSAFNPDTDGDGTSDFDEVNQDGDPDDYNPGAGDTDPNDGGDSPGVCTVAPPNLVAWYPGDGDASDIVGGNDGAVENGAGFAPGRVDDAFSFGNTGAQQVSVPDAAALDLAGAMTLEAWVKTTDYGCGDTRRIVTKIGGGGPFFGYSLDIMCFAGAEQGKLRFELHDSGGTNHRLDSLNVVPTGAFVHVAGTYDGSTMKLYINGVLDSSLAAGAFSVGQNGAPLQIGNFINTFNGLIDEVGIFDRALTAGEIAAIHAAGNGGKCKPFSATDSDSDGLSDALETSLGTDPGLPDSDGDGYGDFDEVNRDGGPANYQPGVDTDPNDPDSDNDDVNDFLEINAGTDPNVAETSATRFYLKPSGTGAGTSWADAAGSVTDANAWLNSRPSADVFYLLFAGDPGYSYGAPLAINDQTSPGVGVPPFSVVVAIGGLDPDAAASQQGLYQAQGSLLDGGGDCSDGVPAGSGALVTVGQEELSNLGLIGMKLMNGQVFGANDGGGIQTAAAPGSCGASCPVLVLSESKIGNSCSQDLGGGIYAAENWVLELYNSEISGNEASAGGGIYAAAGSVVRIVSSSVSGNVAHTLGGGVSTSGTSLDLTSSAFQQNIAFSQVSGGSCAGGAIHASEADVSIQDSLLSDNAVFCLAPTFAQVEAAGGALFVKGSGSTTATIRDSRFLSNECQGASATGACQGGAIHFNLVTGDLRNNLIIGNVAAGKGGGIRTIDNGGFLTLQRNTIAYNQAFDQGLGLFMGGDDGLDAGGGVFVSHNGDTETSDNIIFFNDDGTVSGTHDTGEDCASGLVMSTSSHDTIGIQSCASAVTSLVITDPEFTRGFYLDQATSSSVNNGSAADADSFYCALIGGCPPDHPFTTNISGARDTGALDRGFHYTAAAHALLDGATAAPGQDNNAIGGCSLTYGFNITAAGVSGPDFIGHRVGVCLVSAGDAAAFDLSGQGAIDPVNYDGSVPAGCSERAVMATDSGINGIYSVSLSSLASNGPYNIGLRIFVDDNPSFTHTISGATFNPGCGLF